MSDNGRVDTGSPVQSANILNFGLIIVGIIRENQPKLAQLANVQHAKFEICTAVL
jgi:hypothetical protein